MRNWDNEIDEVARAITEGEPDGSLKARVLARIDGPPRSTWRSPWILAPIATAAIVIVAVMVMPGREEVRLKPDTTIAMVPLPSTPLRPGKPDTTADAVPLKPDTTTDGKPTQSVVASAFRRANTVVGSAFRRTDAVVGSAFRRTDEDLDSLAPPPLELEPIGVNDMDSMESLQVPALSVALLDVPAIGEP